MWGKSNQTGAAPYPTPASHLHSHALCMLRSIKCRKPAITKLHLVPVASHNATIRCVSRVEQYPGIGNLSRRRRPRREMKQMTKPRERVESPFQLRNRKLDLPNVLGPSIMLGNQALAQQGQFRSHLPS